MAVTEKWIETQLQQNRAAFSRFAEETWLLDGRGVAYWPKTDTLVVSDLHFEKGSYLYQRGNPLPALDTRATIKRLEAVVNSYQPRRVLSLGDSFHDMQSFARMTDADKNALTTLVQSVNDWLWVEGNHDPTLPDILPGMACSELFDQGVHFRHEPVSGSTPQMIGHYHPKAVKQIARRRFSGKCFVVTPSLMIMPAFGQYTGGLNIDDDAILSLAPPHKRMCYLLYEERIAKY